MAGLPKKYMKMGLADGWKAFKKTDAYKKSKGTVSKIKQSVSKITKSEGGRIVKEKAKKAWSKAKPFAGQGGSLLMQSAVTAGTIVAGNLIVNKVPVVSNLSSRNKALAQTALGVTAGLVSKNKIVQMAGAGLAVAGILNLLKEVPALQTLAGAEDSPTLTPEEIMMISQDQSPIMGKPYSMGKPSRVESMNGWDISN